QRKETEMKGSRFTERQINGTLKELRARFQVNPRKDAGVDPFIVGAYRSNERRRRAWSRSLQKRSASARLRRVASSSIALRAVRSKRTDVVVASACNSPSREPVRMWR